MASSSQLSAEDLHALRETKWKRFLRLKCFMCGVACTKKFSHSAALAASMERSYFCADCETVFCDEHLGTHSCAEGEAREEAARQEVADRVAQAERSEVEKAERDAKAKSDALSFSRGRKLVEAQRCQAGPPR